MRPEPSRTTFINTKRLRGWAAGLLVTILCSQTLASEVATPASVPDITLPSASDAVEEHSIDQGTATAPIDEDEAKRRAMADARRQRRQAQMAGAWTGVAGGITGAYTLSMLGALSPSASAGLVPLSFVAGATGGAIGGYLLGKDRFTPTTAQWLTSSVLWSVPLGAVVGWGLEDQTTKTCERQCLGLGLLAHHAIVGSALYHAWRTPIDVSDIWEQNVGVLSAVTATTGFLRLLPSSDDKRLGYLTLGAVPLASMWATARFARDLHMDAPTSALSVVAGLQGMVLGYMVGDLTVAPAGPLGSTSSSSDDEDRRIGTMSLVGGLSAAVPLLLSTQRRATVGDTAALSLGWLAADMAGFAVESAGFGDDEDSDPRWGTATRLATTLAGTGLATWAVTRGDLRLTTGDIVHASASALDGLTLGYLWGVWSHEQNILGNGASQALFLSLFTAGTTAGLITTQNVRWTSGEALWAHSGLPWGLFIGASVAEGLNARDKDALLTTALTGTLGLGTTLWGMSPGGGAWTSHRSFWTTVGGLAGGAVGSLLPLYFAPDHPERAALLCAGIGSTMGLVAGNRWADELPDIASQWGARNDEATPTESFPTITSQQISPAPTFDPSSGRPNGWSLQWAGAF